MAERAALTGFDLIIESLSRLLARRLTRRSFLGWLGRGTLLVAGGTTFVGLLANRAGARVCGQSGVSPKCPTFDCTDGVWGWCWYANGCCSEGRLKKICDCCAPVNNVHGYCPSGNNVKCVVESCGTDPRVQTVSIARVQTDSAASIAAAFSRVRFARESKPTVVLSNADDPLSAAIAATAAAATGGPLLLTPPDHLGTQVTAELQRLGATDVKIVGLDISESVDANLSSYGRVGERVFTATNHHDLSAEVADWVRARTHTTRAVCVEPSGLSQEMAPVAGAAAASKGMLFLVGADVAAAKATSGVIVTYMVGPEAAARSNEVAGAKAVRSGDALGSAAELASYMDVVEHADVSVVALAPSATNAGLAAAPGLVLLHARPGSIDGARDWLLARRGALRKVYAVGAAGALNNDGYYEAQSAVNGFDAHLLIGVAGQGLPVIEQPGNEQPIGRARVGPLEPAPAPSRYWTGRG